MNHSLFDVREQAAVVRALLDEIERALPAGSSAAIDVTLAEELSRLSRICTEVARCARTAA